MTFLEDRTIGDTGLSIGTHLALESVFHDSISPYDKNRTIPNKIDINRYKYHIFNMYTIIRNIMSACTHKYKDEIIQHKDFINTIIDEINIITYLYMDYKCKPIFISPDYSKLHYSLNKGKESVATLVYIEHKQIYHILKKAPKNLKEKMLETNFKFPTLEGEILLTTSVPVDLLNKGNITLLESHTGKIKTKSEFNSKFHKLGKADLSNMPFIEELVYILGDTSFVLPLKVSVRRPLYELSIEKNWTYRTSRDKVLSDIKNNDELKFILKDFSRSYL